MYTIHIYHSSSSDKYNNNTNNIRRHGYNEIHIGEIDETGGSRLLLLMQTPR